MEDELKFVIETYGDTLRKILGTTNISISFFASSEDYVDEIDPIKEPSLLYKDEKNAKVFPVTIYQDFSIGKKMLTDCNICKLRADGREFVFIKFITPFTRNRSYDFIASKADEMELILKELNIREEKANFQNFDFPIIGIDFELLKKETIDFLLNEEFRSYCRAHRIQLKRGLVLEGKPGCLSKDTKVLIRTENKKGGKLFTIEEAYYKFNNIKNEKIFGRMFWDRKCKKYIQSLVKDKLKYREIDEILDSGLKETFEIKTNTGKKIKCTDEHPFKVVNEMINERGLLEKDNFVQLKDLKIGDFIYCKNSQKKSLFKTKGRSKGRKIICGINFHPLAPIKKVGKYSYKRLQYSRLIIEAKMNNLEINDFIKILKEDNKLSKELKYLSKDNVVHHINSIVNDDRLENLKVLSKKEHDKIHAKNEYFSDTLPSIEEIISIKKIGVEKTFDIVMKGESKNFVANDFVVHNTGKTLSLRWLKEQALKNKITFVNFKSPKEFLESSDGYYEDNKKIFVFEDFDQLLRERKDNDNSPNQILGAVLNTLEGINAIHDVVSVFTTNKIDLFDSAFLRPGRIDKIITYGLPSREDMMKFFEAYITEHKKYHIYIMNRLTEVSCDVSYAILKGICDDINIYVFNKGNIEENNILEIIKEKLKGATKNNGVKDMKNYIL